jgi:hypothetical protein
VSGKAAPQKNSSSQGPGSHQHHKGLRKHLDMGAAGGFGEAGSGGPLASQNLFEIKKRSIDFFQQVLKNLKMY